MPACQPVILMVEDDPVLGELLCDRLQHAGYAVTDHAILHQGVLEPGLRLIQKPFTLETLGLAVCAVLDA